ncbi:3'-5' exonuclease [Mobilicoccus massiliensis]|uniref:3'-5' exonuclease n=1 Tax=Mobilicoccus massiliensis TaxID=1522310 RepID=UPI000590BD55|nr:3'-5' exonuclease [Mobilicoccus massiliensis]
MPTLIWSKVKDGLDPSMKKKAYAFFEKLQESDQLPGLHIEPIVGSDDSRVRTGRVDDNFRCVLFKLTSTDEPFYVIHGVWPHDKANSIAERVKLSMNPINGVPEVERVLDDIRTEARTPVAGTSATGAPVPATPSPASTPVESPTATTALGTPAPVVAQPPRWVGGLTAEALHQDLGLDADLARAALAAATEDELVEDVIARARVEWQADALLELATGSSIAQVKQMFHLDQAPALPAPEDADEDTRLLASIENHPAAKASFHLIDDDDELRRIIEEGDLGAWRLFLHPEQRTYAEGDRKGSFRLSGGAGTGKTVVAIHRARHLAQRHPEARILLTTFTRNLADDLARGVRSLDDSIALQTRLGQPGVYVKGIDQVAWAVVQRAGDDIADAVAQVLGDSRTDVLSSTPSTLWQEAIEDAGADLPPALATQAFLEAEYTQVVLPNRVTGVTAYIRVRRAGRGVALDRAKRVAVWKVIEAYRTKARAAGTTDFVEKAAIAAAWLDLRGDRPFDHVVVDEAQDLTASHLRLLRALVAPGPNDLFICEDSHQRIYGQKVVLSHCGIDVRGRARRLTLNYRTTQQNLGWAMGILSGAEWSDLEGEQEEHTYHSARTGPRPLLVPAQSFADELDRAAEIVTSWLPDPGADAATNLAAGRAAAPEDIAILVRDRYKRQNLVAALAERNLDVRSVDRDAPRPGKPLAMTMHRAKGLEFTHVLLFGVADGAIPRALKDYESSDADLADALLRERALLYVASTRARDVLAVTWAGKRSPLLAGHSRNGDAA